MDEVTKTYKECVPFLLRIAKNHMKAGNHREAKQVYEMVFTIK